MKNIEEKVKEEININKITWNTICTFLYLWDEESKRNKFDITLEEYYNEVKYNHYKLKQSFLLSLNEVICVMMFMSTEQIVVWDDTWEILNFTIENDEPVGFNIIPRIII